MGVLSGKFSLVGEKSPAGEIIEDDTDHKLLFKEGLEEFVVELYAYWRERESELELESFDDERLPSTIRTIKVGRNEPCPCGSGKKHKKCCALEEKDRTYH